MLLRLVRHADHGHVGKVLTGRARGSGLTATGRAQAEALARHLALDGLDLVVSSPQLRARETAKTIAGKAAARMEIAGDLDEIDFGRWSGQSFDALERDAEWRQWNANRDDACTPAAETMDDAAMRCAGLIEALRRRLPGGSAVLVSHSDVIKACICRYRGISFQNVHDFEIAPASITTLRVGDAGVAVEEVGRCHALLEEASP